MAFILPQIPEPAPSTSGEVGHFRHEVNSIRRKHRTAALWRRVRLAHAPFGNTTPRTRATTRSFRDAPIAPLRLRLRVRSRPRFHHPSVSIAVLAILQPFDVAAVRTPRTKAIARRANRALAASIVRPRGSGPTRHFTAPHLSPAPHFRPPRASSHADARAKRKTTSECVRWLFDILLAGI